MHSLPILFIATFDQSSAYPAAISQVLSIQHIGPVAEQDWPNIRWEFFKKVKTNRPLLTKRSQIRINGNYFLNISVSVKLLKYGVAKHFGK